jgi:hypothetical protein
MLIDEDVAYAIKSQLGNAQDNLHRAKSAARNSDPTKEWGQSGETLQQIIDGYQAEVDRWTRALSSVAA